MVDLTDEDVRTVIQKIASISTPEFLLPEFAQSFVGPQYRIVKTEPYNAEVYAGFNYYAALVICTLTAILIGLNL